MTTLVYLLLGVAFALFAFSAWRRRADGDPASSVEGFARVLAAIDPAATARAQQEREAEATLGAGPDANPSGSEDR